MNKVLLMGRLTKDPDVRYSQGENSLAIARYTLAVDRRLRRTEGGAQNQQTGLITSRRDGSYWRKDSCKGVKTLKSHLWL